MHVAFVISLFNLVAVIAGSVAYAIGHVRGDKAGWERCYKEWGESDRRRADEKRRIDAQMANPQQTGVVTLHPTPCMSAEEQAKLLATWNASVIGPPLSGFWETECGPEPEPKYTKKEILEMFRND